MAGLLKLGLLVIAVVGLTFFAVRIYDAKSKPELKPWHTFVPRELSVSELDSGDWPFYLQAEKTLFEALPAEVYSQVEDRDRIPGNRYFEGSPSNRLNLARDWNRSYLLEPQGTAKGAVVLLHGLTDSPYSLRHIAKVYQDAGFLVIGLRLPGHGTVPGGLTNVKWQQWLAATRLAIREARRRVPGDSPLHLVGYSAGGGLVVKYALDSLDDPTLPRASHLTLISPMIGVTGYARFAGLAGLPAIFPAFAKAAWMDVLPEYNPFKYNSFPLNAARQSYLLTSELQEQLEHDAEAGKLSRLPPVQTFQSLVDYTVSTPAVIDALYARLPDNGSELVLFDLNRSLGFETLLGSGAHSPAALLPAAPRLYRSVIVGNASVDDERGIAHVVEIGSRDEQVVPLEQAYPREVFSLSHVALPFPMSDSLYGLHPDEPERFGVQLGALSVRGERGVLLINMEALQRVTANPFFPYLVSRMKEHARLP